MLTPELETKYPDIARLRIDEGRPYVQYSLRGELLRQDAVLQIAVGAGMSTTEALRNAASTFQGHSYMYPTLDESGHSAHPFLIWWEVLYGLSRLARYKPREWIRLIDVSQHADAAAIEYGLGVVIANMPEIAFDALRRSTDDELLAVGTS